MNTLCQALRLEGMSPADEYRLENRLRFLEEHNGVEFVIRTLKVLKEHTVSNLDDKQPHTHKDGEISIAWNAKHDRPKGDLGLIYKTWPKPIPRLRAIGAMIQSYTLDTLSAKQVDRLISGFTYQNRTEPEVGINLPNQALFALDKILSNRWSKKKDFSGVDLTATAIPVGKVNYNCRPFKEALSKRDSLHILNGQKVTSEHTKAFYELDSLTILSKKNAPKETLDYVERNRSRSNNDQIIPNLPSSKLRHRPEVNRPHDRLPVKGNWPADNEPFLGTVGLLQQPGGKLRSIINVNRYVNYAMDPYAKALEDVFYKHPSIAVHDQKSGMKWAQDKIREGKKLSSIDLSQATDLLDFRVLTRGLSRMGDRTPFLTDAVNHFEYLAQLPVYIPELNGSVCFNTGQPLGMKSSFQTLTVMNTFAGMIAANNKGLDLRDSFRVVGDDFVCLEEMASEYSQIISSWGGKTNLEKCLTSDKYAEFCSHIITRDNMVSIKPRYRPGYNSIFLNAEKSSNEKIQKLFRVTKKDTDVLTNLAAISDRDRNNLPDIPSSFKLPKEDRELVSKVLRNIKAVTEGGIHEVHQVSSQSLDVAHETYSPGNRKYIDIYDEDGVIGVSRGTVHHNGGEFTDAIDRYDHRSGTRVETQSMKLDNLVQQARELSERANKIVSVYTGDSIATHKAKSQGTDVPRDDNMSVDHPTISTPIGINIDVEEAVIKALYEEDDDLAMQEQNFIKAIENVNHSIQQNSNTDLSR